MQAAAWAFELLRLAPAGLCRVSQQMAVRCCHRLLLMALLTLLRSLAVLTLLRAAAAAPVGGRVMAHSSLLLRLATCLVMPTQTAVEGLWRLKHWQPEVRQGMMAALWQGRGLLEGLQYLHPHLHLHLRLAVSVSRRMKVRWQ